MNFEALQSTGIDNLQHQLSTFDIQNFNNANNTNNFALNNISNPMHLFGNDQNSFSNQNEFRQYNQSQETFNVNNLHQNNPSQSQFTSPTGQLPSYSNNNNSLPQFYNNNPDPASYYNNNSQSSVPHQTSLQQPNFNLRNAFIKIIEQPSKKPVRFRYTCEGRAAEHILGEFNTEDRKSYPKVKICNYKGIVKLVVSCITTEEPYRAHPHKLIGKNCGTSGLCEVKLTENMQHEFCNLGVQCVKKQDVVKSIKTREQENVDPFMQGFNHDPNTFNLNSIRLCFQAFVKNSDGKTEPLKPVVSNQIFDVKAKSELKICRLCSCSCNVDGGQTLMLTCEKVNKENIKIRFFEEINGEIIWQDFGSFEPTDVHKQTAIAFKTPAYYNKNISSPVTVNIQLLRPTDNVTSEPLPFDYIPSPAVSQRLRSAPITEIMNFFSQYDINTLSTTETQQLPSTSHNNLIGNPIPKVELLSPNVAEQNQWNFPSTSHNSNFTPNAMNQTYQNQIYQPACMLSQNNNTSSTNNFNFPNQLLNNSHIINCDQIMESNSADLSSMSLNG